MPPDVVARLDGVLDDLRTEDPAGTPATHDEKATVVPLESHRRRSRFAKLVLAAAAVVAIGYGVGQVATGTLGRSSSDSGSGAVADKSTNDESGGDSGSGQAAEPGSEGYAPLDGLGIAGLEPIDPDSASDSLTTLRDEPADGQYAASRRALMDVCGPRRTPAGARLVPAAYDGRPTLVLFRAPQGGSQRVDLYLCDGPTPRVPFRTVALDGE